MKRLKQVFVKSRQIPVPVLALAILNGIWIILIPIQKFSVDPNVTAYYFFTTILLLLAFFLFSLLVVFKARRQLVRFKILSDILLTLLIASISGLFLYGDSKLVLNGNPIQAQFNPGTYLEDFIFYNVTLIAFFGLRKWGNSSIREKFLLGAFVWVVGLFLSAVSLFLANTLQDQLEPTSSYKYSKFEYGNSGDTLFVVLDSFQGSHFDRIMTRYPSETSFLNGFTYFPDTVASYPTTRGSSTNFSTGTYNLNSQEQQLHVEAKNHFIDFFKENKYDLDLAVVPISGAEYNFSKLDIVQSAEVGLPESLHEMVMTLINNLEISLFKLVPNVLKPLIYNSGRWVITGRIDSNYDLLIDVDKKFLRNFESKVSIRESGNKVFHFYHLFGAHLPQRSLTDFPEFDLETSNDSLLDNSRIALFKLKVLLDRLKELQIYDSLKIVVISDHGYGFPRLGSSSTGDVLEIEMAESASDAILLSKPINSFGDLAIASVPMSLLDVPCLLTSGNFVSGCNLVGTNIWKNNNGDSVRRFFSYIWRDDAWQGTFLPPLQEFFVRGNSTELTSWSKVASLKDPRRPEVLDFLPIDSTLQIGDSGVSEYLILNGFSFPEGPRRWSLGSRCTIEFKVNPKDIEKGISVEIGISPLQYSEVGKQLHVFVNNKFLKTYMLDNPNVPVLINVPITYLDGEEVNIAFETPGSISPQILNGSVDSRLLGRAFSTFRVEKK